MTRPITIQIPAPDQRATLSGGVECSGMCPLNDSEFTMCRAGFGTRVPVYLQDYAAEDGRPSFHVLVPSKGCPWYEEEA
jgi:hypothetical protein